MRLRRARGEDAPAIYRLIAHYAANGLLLPRTEQNIRGKIHNFLVLTEKNEIAGCVALEPYGPDLAEVRSLAVNPGLRGRGIGSRLVAAVLEEARRRKIASVFAVTHAPEFFLRQGFALSIRQALPEKMERDCRACPKARSCRLAAVITAVTPERAGLRIFPEPASVAPVA